MTARTSASRQRFPTAASSDDGVTKAQMDAAISGIVSGTAPNSVQLVGDGESHNLVINHALGTRYVNLQIVRATSPYDNRVVPFERTTIDAITIRNEEVWGLGEYIAIITFASQSDTSDPNPGVLNFSSSTSSSLTYSFSGQTDASGISRVDAHDAGDNTLIASNIASPWTRDSLLASHPYGTYLKVYDNENNVANSNTVTHSTDAPVGDITNPTPGALTFVSKTDTTISYTFTGGSDNVGVDHVDIYDGTSHTVIDSNVTSPWVRGSGTGANAPLTPSTSYGTYARYVDAAGNFADSSTDSRSTNAPPSSSNSYIDSRAEKTTGAMVTMPSHQAGDLLVMFAYRVGFSTPPSVASGWTDKGSDSANTNAVRVGYKIAASSSEVSGTWTNALYQICLVYRGATLVGAVAFGNGVGLSVTIPAVTLQNTDGTSWVVSGAGYKNNTGNLHSAPSLTSRANYDGSGSQGDVGSFDTGAGVTTSPSSTITFAGTSAGWETFAMELRVS